MRCRAVLAQSAHFPVQALCKVLAVSRSGFYAWRQRQDRPSARALREQGLRQALARLHAASRHTYGSPRLWREARSEGLKVGRHATARLMRQAGLRGACRRRRRASPGELATLAPNHLQRAFAQAAPDQVWVADITTLPTRQGTLYLAVVMDLFARRVVGHAMAEHMRVDLPLAALDMAIGQRRPGPGLLHHSDQGSQYTSTAYQAALRNHAITASMSRKGNCWDNAVVESFFATLKSELRMPRRYASVAQARADVFDYIEVFYNRQRRHSTNDYRSPAQAERAFA